MQSRETIRFEQFGSKHFTFSLVWFFCLGVCFFLVFELIISLWTNMLHREHISCVIQQKQSSYLSLCWNYMFRLLNFSLLLFYSYATWKAPTTHSIRILENCETLQDKDHDLVVVSTAGPTFQMKLGAVLHTNLLSEHKKVSNCSCKEKVWNIAPMWSVTTLND